MEERYVFDYINEPEFRKSERYLKKYNMLAYKRLIFECYPSLKEGKFLGEIIPSNNNQIISYELKLPTDAVFEKVYGSIKLYYNVYKKEKKIIMKELIPKELDSIDCFPSYKGVMVSKEIAAKDRFKINLLNMIKK